MNLIEKLFPGGDASVAALLPFADMEQDCVKLRDGGYLDILEFTCKDLANASQDEIEYDILTMAKFFKTFGGDCKLVSLNFPTDTLPQQGYISHKLRQTRNEVFKKHLEQKLAELVYIEQHRTNREYYLFLFFESLDRRRDGLITVQTTLGGGGLIGTLSPEKKKDILFKICNMSTSILSKFGAGGDGA